MTVRLLCDWEDSRNGRRYKVGNLLTTDAGTEAGLVAAKLADADLSGGTQYAEPPMQKQVFPVMGEFDHVTGGIKDFVASGRSGLVDLGFLQGHQFAKPTAYFGDSMTVGAGSTIGGYVACVAEKLGRLVQHGSINLGVAGEQSSLVKDRVLAADLTQYGAVVFFCGANNVTAGVGVESFAADMQAMAEAAIKARVPFVMVTVPPRSAPATVNASTRLLTARYNAVIYSLCHKYGARVADAWSKLADPATGDLAATSSYDGLHFNNTGALAVADEVSTRLSEIYQPSPLSVLFSVGANIITNPNFSSSFGDTYYWNAQNSGVTPTVTTESDAFGVLGSGKWLTHSFTGAGIARHVQGLGSVGTKWAVGDKILFGCRIRVDDGSSTYQTDAIAGSASASMAITNQSSALITSVAATHYAAPGWQGTIFTVPDGTTSMSAIMQTYLAAGKTYKARYGDALMINLTQYPEFSGL